MNLYISDLHFGHKNCIRFDNRPFADTDEMDRTMIQLWNSRVSIKDDVYILGDLCFRSEKTPDWYLKKLNGHKHLIVGNHDRVTLECEEAQQYLESIDNMLYIEDDGRQICLCHYPLAAWYKSHRGSWHIYGHIHANKDDVYQLMKTKEHALNAAACINNYTPATIEELIRNNKFFQESDTGEELLFAVTYKPTGKRFLMTFGDLYGYEGEVCGMIIKGGRLVFAENELLDDKSKLNPDISIRLAGENDKGLPRIPDFPESNDFWKEIMHD